jgi:hypothetical protein
MLQLESRNVPVVCPVIHKVHNELDTVFLSTLHHSVQTLKPIDTRINRCGTTGEGLEVHGTGAGDALDIVCEESRYEVSVCLTCISNIYTY